jgi:hypothetical protein
MDSWEEANKLRWSLPNGLCRRAHDRMRGNNTAGDKGRAKVSRDEAKMAQAAKDDEENNEDAIDLVAEGANVGAKGLTAR